MFRYFLNMRELRQLLTDEKTYRVIYTVPPGTYMVTTEIKASSPYHAARKFDQDPNNHYKRRHGPATLA